MDRANGKKYYYRFSWMKLIRPMTLTGTITPILAGTALASVKGPIRLDIFIAMSAAAILVQAATNMFNDYYDFLNGQDQEKWILHDQSTNHHGPALHSIPIVAGSLIATAIVIGAWLALNSHAWIAWVGALGIWAGYKYSAGSNSLSSKGLGELVAAVFLGTVVTTLAYVVQGYDIDLSILAVSLPYSFLIASMILTNNIRDIEKDRPYRKTIAILLGRKNAVRLLYTFIASAYGSVMLLIFFHVVCWSAAMVLLSLPISVQLLWSFRSHAKRIDEINGMKWAAWQHWSFGLLFAGSLWFHHL